MRTQSILISVSRLWASILEQILEQVESIKKKSQYEDLTQTPIPQLILRLGIPTTISMLVTSVYNMADSYFVGDEGSSAAGSIGVVFGLMALIQAFGFMFGQGTGISASKALGAKDPEKATVIDSTGFFWSLFVGAVIGALGLIFLEPLMNLLGSTPTILPYAKKYSFYILMAAPLMVASCTLNNILRFEGKALFAMIGLASGGLLNIFGDWLLVKHYGMGVMGAGIATAVSQSVSFIILLSMFLRGKTSGKLRFSKISGDYRDLFLIVTVGLPSLVRQGISSISSMVLNNCAGIYGDAAVAAMAICNRVCFFTFATALGIGQGFQPVCSFNFGAKKYDRVRKGYLFTVMVGEVFLGIVAIIGFIVAPNVIGIFIDNGDRDAVISIGTVALKAQFVAQLFQPIAVCTNMLFQGVGESIIATLLSMCRSGLFFIPTLLILTNVWGLPGVQYSQAVGDILTFFVATPCAIWYLSKLKQMASNMTK